MAETAIKLEHLSKYYKLGVINNGTLFRDIQSWVARKRGKDDPHSKIGANQYFDATSEGFWALKDLNLDIQQGDRVGIIGKNGAGKSTLLKVLSRITAPTEGTAKIKGRVASLLEVGTGFHRELTGRENIYLNGAILGMKRKEVDRKIDEIIAFSEIEQHIDTPVKRYSSGMYVRLAFAVAAHLDSEILIADEVLAVGDVTFQKKALGKMNELSSGQGRTVLFVSHNMTSIKQLCNKGVVLEKGRVVFSGDIDEAIAVYNGDDDVSSVKEINSWINTGKVYDCYFNPLKLEILDKFGNLQEEALDYDKEYKVRLTFNAEELDWLVGFWVYIQIENKRLYTVSPDNKKGQKIEIGTNIFEFTIREKSLIPGQVYKIVLGADFENVKYILNPLDEEIVINLPVKNEKNILSFIRQN